MSELSVEKILNAKVFEIYEKYKIGGLDTIDNRYGYFINLFDGPGVGDHFWKFIKGKKYELGLIQIEFDTSERPLGCSKITILE